MTSLFSRSRTKSTPKLPKKQQSLSNYNSQDAAASGPSHDEFGRVSSRVSNRSVNISLVGKKDKDKKKSTRGRTVSSPADAYDPTSELLASIPDGSFLPLNLELPRNEQGVERPKEHDYGYLSYERHVVLGLEEVARLVDVVADELGTRGLTTPFIFSTLALDISSNGIKRLIQAFLRTCSSPSAESERLWREEARFAGPHELGMCLRWGLARVVRVVGGQDYRGLIAWDRYTEFRDSEAANNYPPAHFQTFLPSLHPLLRTIILTLLSVLTRLTAHSASSGHTPPTLSPLFGPLFFGLGPATLAFHHTYHHYLRATNAMEHILLAFIRWQDAPHSGVDAVPTRLKDWIRGYPAMLPFLHDRQKNDRPQARRGARTVRVVSVRRNVRMYSSDLVKTAASWAQRPRVGTTSNGDRGLTGSKEWDRIAPATLKLPPRYSEQYKKRMDLAPNFHPDMGSSSLSSLPSTASSTSSATSTLLDDKDYFSTREGEERFRSLTDLKWGEFEAMGFGDGGNDKKLQFDLTEGARTARAAKRATLSWNDFSNAGFSRTDAPLNATLQFSTPVSHTISSWPSHNAELARKLKKTQRALPAFGWDTEPVMGSEEVIEEAFIDVFCDLIYGGGWMDLERGEELDRECNWALVEYKSLPISRTTTTTAATDPRTATSLVLYEEFVPLEYRQQLAVTSTNRRRLPSLFSAGNKSKQWKQATTLNGRPYVVGHVPNSPSYREVEFEGLLHSQQSTTKLITLSGPKSSGPPPTASPAIAGLPVTSPLPQTPRTPRQGISSPLFAPTRPDSKRVTSPDRADSPRRGPRFRLPGGIPVPSPGANRKSGLVPAEYSTVDFETRSASYSDDELEGEPGSKTSEDRRRSKDDAWVDILVATQSRRMGGQEAEMRRPAGARPLRSGRSDPELASQEVAQALAGVRARSPISDDDDDNGIEAVSVSKLQDYGVEPHDGDAPRDREDDELDPDVDSIVSYPRSSKRVGYFDLHPDRRPSSQLTIGEDDMRPRLAGDRETYLDDDASDYSERKSSEQAPPALPLKSPTHQTTPPDLPAPTIDLTRSPPSKPALPSKTAALIEMYRQKETKGSTPVAPSLIPRRPIAKDQAPLPSVPVATPSPPPPTADLNPEPLIAELPRVPLEETGRASPARYVHGAPLHNVLEEEEEEV